MKKTSLFLILMGASILNAQAMMGDEDDLNSPNLSPRQPSREVGLSFSPAPDNTDSTHQTITRLPDDFHGHTYISLYPDLEGASAHMNPEEKETWGGVHYTQNGFREGRKYNYDLPQYFSGLMYISLYSDLEQGSVNMNPYQKEAWGRMHHAKHGSNEGRIYSLPEDFNSDIYLSLNSDLDKAVETGTQEERERYAEQHFASHGRLEQKRPYFPNDFIPETYLSLYPFVAEVVCAASLEEREKRARRHYALRGHEQGRIYRLPDVIDAETYLLLNRIQYNDYKGALKKLEEKFQYLGGFRRDPDNIKALDNSDANKPLPVACARHIRRPSHGTKLNIEHPGFAGEPAAESYSAGRDHIRRPSHDTK